NIVQERQPEDIEADVVVKDRVRLAERLGPDEADEALPAAREAQPDDEGDERRDKPLAEHEPTGTDLHRATGDQEGSGLWSRMRRGPVMPSDLANEEVQIDPDEDEDDRGYHDEEPEPDQ